MSTPAEQVLDAMLLAELYNNSAELERFFGLLVSYHYPLIAEGYFNEGSLEQLFARHSATKSYTSALVGFALEQGCLSSLDVKMLEFFLEFTGDITDTRKEQITIRDLLQMRAGYPYDSAGHYSDILYLSGNWRWLPHLVDFPLVSDPGTEIHYSSVISHLLGVIVTRACDIDLMSYAQEHLFSPIDTELGDWTRDADGYNSGWGEIYVAARDMAKSGSLYLNDGEYEGSQVVSADWVHDSLQTYSEDAWDYTVGPYFRDIGYGYQWCPPGQATIAST